MKPFRHLSTSILLTLTALTLWAYWDVRQNDFVNLDDYDYVVHNRHVQRGWTLEGVIWAFTSTHSNNWHPLTWLSHMVDAEIFGLNPGAHHWSSLLLHIANTLLLFLLWERMTGALWRSALVAALFSLHPLHVESVAWVSERKDVLCGLFFMASVLAYTGYARRGGVGRYSLTLILFTLGLLSKPMLVTLPFLLLLLDYWPLGRFSQGGQGKTAKWPLLLRLCGEKIPFFLLSACSAVTTFLVQKATGAMVSVLPLETRLGNALVSYVRYVLRVFWPLDLACFYPYPVSGPEIWQVAGAALFLIAVTLWSLRTAGAHPYFMVGWLWFLGSLIPVIGLVQVGEQAMADRYTYLPLIGLFVAIVWALSAVPVRRALPRTLFTAACGITLLALIFLTREQVKTWRDTTTLLEHEIRVTPGNFLAHFHLAAHLAEQGMLEDAHDHLSESLRIRPRFALGLHHMGNLMFRMGSTEEALGYFLRALELDPRDYRTHTNMGFVLLQQGKTREALGHFSEALRIQPEDRIAQHNLGLALQKLEGQRMP